jgi:hypothetical protein
MTDKQTDFDGLIVSAATLLVGDQPPLTKFTATADADIDIIVSQRDLQHRRLVQPHPTGRGLLSVVQDRHARVGPPAKAETAPDLMLFLSRRWWRRATAS